MLDAILSLTSLSAVAHRGGSKLRPENTLAAFDHAVALGVDAIECDVHLSRGDAARYVESRHRPELEAHQGKSQNHDHHAERETPSLWNR